MLPSHLHTIVFPLRARLQCTSDPYVRVVPARDLALFTVAFETTKRGDELSRTLIQGIIRLPNLSGFLFNFQRGKTMRDGAYHLISVAYNHECLATCPVTAVVVVDPGTDGVIPCVLETGTTVRNQSLKQ